MCDLLPETRINPSQEKAIRERYAPLIEKYNLNPVTIPKRPTVFCDEERAAEITDELMESQAPLLVLLGDIPISQYLNRVADITVYVSRANYTTTNLIDFIKQVYQQKRLPNIITVLNGVKASGKGYGYGYGYGYGHEVKSGKK